MLHTKALADDFSDDSESSLPDLSAIFRNPVAPISSGDIVFAKFRGLYWPALVKTIYPTQKKMTICYCDEPSKTFKLPFRNVCSFFDIERRPKIENDIREAGYFAAFDGLCSHAQRYLERRKKGYNDDPMKFFDQTYPFFLAEKLLKLDPNAHVKNLKIPPIYSRNEEKAVFINTSSAFKDEPHCSDVASSVSTDMSESETESVDYATPKNPLWETSNLSTNKYEKKIIKHILSGKSDIYLKKILTRTISSDFYKVYEESIVYGKKNLKSTSFTGPIEDSYKVSELTCYLLSFLGNTNIVHNACNQFNNTISKKHFHNKIDTAYFIASVMLPESIICAIAEIHGVSLSEAKHLFQEGPKSCSRVIKNIVSSPDVPIQETDNNSLKKMCERKLKTIKDGNILNVDCLLRSSCDFKSSKMTMCDGSETFKNAPNFCGNNNEGYKLDESIDKDPIPLRTSSEGSESANCFTLKSSDNLSKMTESIYNTYEMDNDTERKMLGAIIEDSSSKFETVLPQNVPRKSRKYSKSSCLLKFNEITEADSEVCDNSTEQHGSDGSTEFSNLKCDTVSFGTLSKRSKRSLKSSCDNIANIISKCGHKVLVTDNDAVEKELVKNVEETNSKCNTLLHEKVPKKSRKNSKYSCSKKSNKITKTVSEICDTNLERFKLDECTEGGGCNLKRDTVSLGALSKKSKISLKSSCNNITKRTTKSLHNVCETDCNDEEKESDKIIEISSSNIKTVPTQEISKKKRKNSKFSSCKKSNKITMSEISETSFERYGLDECREIACDLRCYVALGMDLYRSNKMSSSSDNIANRTRKAVRNVCEFDCNDKETEMDKFIEIASSKNITVPSEEVPKKRRKDSKSKESNRITKAVSEICETSFERYGSDERTEVVCDLKCDTVALGMVSNGNSKMSSSSDNIANRTRKLVHNVCETDYNDEEKESDKITEISSSKIKTVPTQEIPKKMRKNSKSSSPKKSNKITMSEISETSFERYGSDECTETACNLECYVALGMDLNRSNKMSSSSDNIANRTRKSVCNVCEIDCNDKETELDKFIEIASSKNKTVPSQEVPKKRRKNSKSKKSNRKKNKKSFIRSFVNMDRDEITKSVHMMCETDNTDTYQSDEIIEASVSKCKTKASKKSKRPSKHNVIKTKEAFSSVYNTHGTTIDVTDNNFCETGKATSIEMVKKSSKFSCNVKPSVKSKCNNSETIHQVQGNKTDSDEEFGTKCGTFSSKITPQKCDSQNLICPFNDNITVKGLCNICGNCLEGEH